MTAPGATRSRAPVTTETVQDVALVHDYLLVERGAERSFAAIAACWPDAPIHTLLFDRERMGPWFPGHEVHTSGLQRLGIGQDGFRRLLPLYPRAVEKLDVSGHDVVVSSSSAFAHGVRPDRGAKHLCYCYTPFRYAWHERERALREVPGVARPLLSRSLQRIREWDREASEGVDRYVAISELSRDRIFAAYGRDSAVVHPPVQTHRFAIGEPEDFFLMVCEIVCHKRVDVALEAARRAGVRMKVVGEGPDRARLEAEYGDRADFLGRLGDEALAELYPRARAVVVPNVEEFGIAAVEGQAAGRPVIARNAGGTSETVIDGATGVLLASGSVEELAEAMAYVDFDRFDPTLTKLNADRFSVATFQERIRAEVDRLVAPPPSSSGRFTRSRGVVTVTPPQPDVTVVVPVWGAHAAYLPEAVDSVRRQVGPATRILVVDNASDDPIAAPFPGVEVIRTPERLRVGAARNYGLGACTTPYVMFWDADDLMLPGALLRLWSTLRKAPEAVAATLDSDGWDPVHGRGEPWPWPRSPMYRLCRHPRRFALLARLVNPFTTTGPALMRTDAVRDAGGFAEDITFYEDWALSQSLTVRGRIIMLREPGRLYRVHPDSLSLGHLGHDEQRAWLTGLRRRTRRDPTAPRWLKALLPLIRLAHVARVRRPKRASEGIGFYEQALGTDAASLPVAAPDVARSDRPLVTQAGHD